MDNETEKRIADMIKSKRIFLFMKGSPDMPQCGFSAQVVEILQKYTKDFEYFDVLADEEIRQGIKEYSNWPTIPQLYIDGKLIGGCDIITEMDEKGQLAPLLEA